MLERLVNVWRTAFVNTFGYLFPTKTLYPLW